MEAKIVLFIHKKNQKAFYTFWFIKKSLDFHYFSNIII